jgi:hypothetical protein
MKHMSWAYERCVQIDLKHMDISRMKFCLYVNKRNIETISIFEVTFDKYNL